jgi:hypothetical protein
MAYWRAAGVRGWAAGRSDHSSPRGDAGSGHVPSEYTTVESLDRTNRLRLYTVKIHGEEWTLKSSGVVVGDEHAMRPWDVVNVVVDPQQVDLMTVGMRCWKSM